MQRGFYHRLLTALQGRPRAGRAARSFSLLAAVCCAWLAAPAAAQDDADAEPDPGWTNETELSLALTGGNSTARTLGFGNTLRYAAAASRLQVRLNGLRSRTAVDPFLLVVPGVRFSLTGAPDAPAVNLVRPGSEPEAEHYELAGRYDMEISERLFWNAGGSWDRNREAGILSRYSAFSGFGNVWRDSDGLRLSTTYAVSFTNRREETDDPEKDARFAGARLGVDYRSRLSDAVVHDGILATNVNLGAAADYSLNATTGLSVALNPSLALRISLQLLYEHDPALEDVAVLARVAIVDPDGVPGSGDELFETVAGGGTTIALGTDRVRRDRLDAIFRTALVIGF